MSKYVVCVEVEVEDQALLEKFARERYEECWGEVQGDALAGIEEVLMEALHYSNMNPNPDEIGINYTGTHAVMEGRLREFVD